jgi:thioredoxin reductase/Pyruvate/2-oxoacid:ferredoxin oxidoreductase delta subunit
MSWTLLASLVAALGATLLVRLLRRAELERMHASVRLREDAEEQGASEARLHHPVVDLTRCLGCGTCVDACPENHVLELVHGQAMVVNGARCVGHAACERECPVGAITVTIANRAERTDIPAFDENLEAVGSPNLFLAGELTAHSLIKTAIEHGASVGAEVARRVADQGSNGVLDLCVVGAGPAGLACSLEARRHGLSFVTLDQERELGGTVAKYPRRKLVLTQPVELPLAGRMDKTSYTKEELVAMWNRLAVEHDLPVQGGQVFRSLERGDDGVYTVRTDDRRFRARHVCLAIGRRGVPRRLGVEGEELPKVSYALLDAHSYRDRRILVVGGGDSAVETALGLAEQPGNEVTLSYRKESLFRIRDRNRERLDRALSENRLSLVLGSDVRAIASDAVRLEVRNGAGPKETTLPNDDVFVMAGGTPPTALLESAGVSFDPALRPAADPVGEQGSGLTRALAIGFFLALGALGFALLHLDYYELPRELRPTHDKHGWLRPSRGLGLGLGVAATAMVLINLLYLARRSPRVKLNFGSLRAWMTSHVATGILALLCAVLHGAMAPGETPGGNALWGLFALLITGAIGRYFYAYVPRAANGRELELAEVKARIGRMSAEWDGGQRRFRARVRAAVDELVEKRQWKGSFAGRVLALLGVRRDLHRMLRRLEQEGLAEGVVPEQVRETLLLARRAHRTALMASHYEDLRAILNTWRFLHRWFAALVVLLIVMHIAHALIYGFGGGGL